MNLGVLMHWFPSESGTTQIEVSLFISSFYMLSYDQLTEVELTLTHHFSI